MEDVGSNYFEDLVSRSFFQKSRICTSDYVMHDLIHDLSQLVSDGECYWQENDNTQEVSSLVRHLLVWHWHPASKTACYQLERKLLVLCRNNKWRSLIFYGNSNITNNLITTTDFWRSLKYIRVLILPESGIVELPEDVGELRHLRYLDISGYYEMERLPDSLCRLHNLQVLKLYNCPIQSFPQGMSKLINLRHIEFEETTLILKIYRIGRLTSLQQLERFEVQKHPGHKLEELSGLTQLHGKLRICNLENVGSKEEANAGKLHNKVFIDSLTLEWTPGSSEGNQLLILEELLKDLKWHPTLKELEIFWFSWPWAAWDENYSWAKDIKLFPSVLHKLRVLFCPKLKRLPPLPPSLVDLELNEIGLMKLPNIWEEIDGSGHCKVATLKSLYINCPDLMSLEDGLLSQNLPCLEVIILSDCEEPMGFPMEKLKVFASLKELQILNCPKLLTMTRDDINYFLTLPQSLKKLSLSNCGDFDKLLLHCLHNLTSLSNLDIAKCPHVRSFPKEPLLHLKQLEYVSISGCDELRSIEGLGVLKSLKDLAIWKCPNLLINGGDEHGKEEEEGGGLVSLRELCIDNTALLKIPPLRNALPSIHRLQIESSVEEVMFEGEEQLLLPRLTVLRILMFSSCKKLQSLPKELHTLRSLQSLSILNCPEIESLPETGLPTSLTDLRCRNANPMLQRQIQEKMKELRSSGRYRSINEWL